MTHAALPCCKFPALLQLLTVSKRIFEWGYCTCSAEKVTADVKNSHGTMKKQANKQTTIQNEIKSN